MIQASNRIMYSMAAERLQLVATRLAKSGALLALGFGLLSLFFILDLHRHPFVLMTTTLLGMACFPAALGALFGRAVDFACWGIVIIISVGCLSAGLSRGYL